MKRRWLGCALTAALVACQADPPPLTQIVVVVDSDMRVPSELEVVGIAVAGALDVPECMVTLGESAEEAAGLPLTLGLVHDGGPLGPLTVTARGLRGGATLVEHRAEVWFQARKTTRLQLDLALSCLSASNTCPSGETCDAGECVTQRIATLPVFDGDVSPRPRGQAGSAGAALPQAGASGSAGTGNDAPQCTISQPADGATFRVGETVRMTGNCTDPDGDRVHPRWRSDRDGTLSYFDIAIETRLTIGTHTITYCGTDGRDSALVGCATIQITIESLF